MSELSLFWNSQWISNVSGRWCFITLNHYKCSYYCCLYHSVQNTKLSIAFSLSLFRSFQPVFLALANKIANLIKKHLISKQNPIILQIFSSNYLNQSKLDCLTFPAIPKFSIKHLNTINLGMTTNFNPNTK